MKTNVLSVKPFRRLVWVLGLEMIIHVAVVIFIADESLRTTLNDILSPLENILVAGTLFYAVRLTAHNNPKLAGSWRWWLLAFGVYILGDISWAVFELILNEAPFPSIADLFYLVFYIFMWLGLINYPVEETSPRERRLALLDNLIVVLGAALAFWYFLINPLIVVSGEVDFLTISLAVAYPIFDLVVFWALLTFFRNRLRQSVYTPLILIGFSLLLWVIADVLYAYQSINEIFLSGSFTDLGWIVGSALFALAAIAQANYAFLRKDQPPSDDAERTRSMSTWPLYLPYIWLAISYGVLIANISIDNNSLPLYLAVGFIIGLVIFRQVLTLNENERLFKKAGKELVERKQAQEKLHQMNLELDIRVQERTKDLFWANEQLGQANQKLEESLQEKEDLLKEVHHRVKNNLQVLSSLLNLQANQVSDPSTIQALRDSQMRVRSMALIHEKLYQSESLAQIDFGEYVENLANELFRSYQREPRLIQLEIQVEKIFLNLDQAVPCGLILSELITNTFKHAFPNGKNGTVTVELHTNPDGLVSLKVADNGVGLPADVDGFNTKSLGLQVVNSLVAQLDGKLEVAQSMGTTFLVSFYKG